MENSVERLNDGEPSHKWPTLLLLAVAELLSISVWFSASAVVPALTALWNLNDSGKAWLTMSIQAGFVAGALGSAILNLADRLPARLLFCLSALVAAATTAAIPLLSRGLGLTLILRFLTGLSLAGVYPVGMKIMASWTRKDRGLAMGLLVGAITIGLAAPHLLRVLGSMNAWKPVLYLASLLTVAGGLITLFLVRDGPYRAVSPRFDWRHVGRILSDRPVLLANLGYLGHMWELFAMMAWMPLFLLASFQLSGLNPVWAGIAAFVVIGVGAPGSVLAGLLADRLGRTRVIVVILVVSGLCSLISGHLFGAHPALLFSVLLVWGFSVNSDSAQYSTCVSELCDPRYIGTALTLQTCLGFLLTMVTIRIVPSVVNAVGWGLAFSILAFGPVVGIGAMLVLRRSPAASRLAGGRG